MQLILSVFFLFTTLAPLSAAPTIYALMVTGKDASHQALAQLAIQAFREQTYTDKILIVVNDGAYDFSHLRDDNIREIHLDHKLTLGQLRNISLDQVPEGEIWMQWDDDDYRHPESMKQQFAFLKKNNLAYCFLEHQVQYASKINSCWVLSNRPILGTIMGKKNALHRYSSMRRSEDTTFFLNHVSSEHWGTFSNPPYLYLRFIHGNNTWHEEHFSLSQKSKNTWKVCPQAREYLSKVLRHYKEAFNQKK